jgi:butyryl-CoA dehydrogenase
MLLFQESISEGALSLVLQCSLYHDLSNASDDDLSKEKYHNLLELLTPIAKTFPAEKGLESISNGLQVLGGYGFCTDYDLEQYYRDIRIMSIYEGTTGIQSLDLMGRKIVMKNGAAMKLLIEEFKDTIESAKAYDELKPYAEHFKTNSKELSDVIMKLLEYALKGDHERYISDATIFMEYMSNIVVAWQWLKMATVAKTSLVTGNNNYSKEFFEKKIHTMKFYFKYELSRTSGIKNILLHPESLTIIEKEKKVFI